MPDGMSAFIAVTGDIPQMHESIAKGIPGQ